jgi:N-sulfoglucosamine sulfohydrolase
MTSERRPSRRTFLEGAASLGIATQLKGVQAAVQLSKPNIVYINSHDTGRYTGPYGCDVPTPNLNKLASRGVLFRNAFSVAPTCSPSRSGLLTGQFPHQNGMLGLVNHGWKMNDYRKHIVSTLKAAGYVTAQAGVQHVAPHPEMIGYDFILSPSTPEHPHNVNVSAKVAAPAAVKFLQDRPQQPFYLEVGFFETHRPYPAPSSEDNPRYIQPPHHMPDVAVAREDMASFHASARIMDNGIGKILDALNELGMAENTLVISTTDHGISFPEAKCSLTDAGWGVSLIMSGPREFALGSVCNAMVSQIDIFPTLCDLVGVSKPSWLEGKSLLPVLKGEVTEVNEAIFAEVTYHAAYEPKRAVRTARWKYIKRFDGRKTPVCANTDPGPTKLFWLDNGWSAQPEAEEKLFDLVFDPDERNNLAADPKMQPVLTDMRTRLKTWMTRTKDPLLLGPIPLADGAKTVDPNDPVRDWSVYKAAQVPTF